MDDQRKKALRECKRRSGYFDGRFFHQTFERDRLCLNEREHIEEQLEDEKEEFSIETSKHRIKHAGGCNEWI